MNNEHPITPPPELVRQWLEDGPEDGELRISKHIATQAARWGADQELDACCKWLRNDGLFETRIGHLRAARRPKPPSLKEQALEVVTGLEKRWDLQCDLTLLRRALEQLD